MGMVPVRLQPYVRSLHGPLSRSVALSYPVTPLAVFAPGLRVRQLGRDQHNQRADVSIAATSTAHQLRWGGEGSSSGARIRVMETPTTSY
jgi:hypothetical protein